MAMKSWAKNGRDLEKNPYTTARDLEPTEGALKQTAGYKPTENEKPGLMGKYFAYEPQKDENGNITRRELKKAVKMPKFIVKKNPISGKITATKVATLAHDVSIDPKTGEKKRTVHRPNQNLDPESAKAARNLTYKAPLSEKEQARKDAHDQHMAGALLRRALQNGDGTIADYSGKTPFEQEKAKIERFAPSSLAKPRDDAYHARPGDIANHEELFGDDDRQKEREAEQGERLKEKARVLDQYYGLGKSQDEIDALAQSDPDYGILQDMPFSEHANLVGMPNPLTHQVTSEGDVVPHDYGPAAKHNVEEGRLSNIKQTYEPAERQPTAEEQAEHERKSKEAFQRWIWATADENRARHEPSYQAWRASVENTPELKKMAEDRGESVNDLLANDFSFEDKKTLEDAINARIFGAKSAQGEKMRAEEEAAKADKANEIREKGAELKPQPYVSQRIYYKSKQNQYIREYQSLLANAMSQYNEANEIINGRDTNGKPLDEEDFGRYDPSSPFFKKHEAERQIASFKKKLDELERGIGLTDDPKEEDKPKDPLQTELAYGDLKQSDAAGERVMANDSAMKKMADIFAGQDLLDSDEGIEFRENYPKAYKALVDKFGEGNIPASVIRKSMQRRRNMMGKPLRETTVYQLENHGYDTSFLEAYDPATDKFTAPTPGRPYFFYTIQTPDGKQKDILLPKGEYFVRDEATGNVVYHGLPRVVTPQKGESMDNFSEVKNDTAELSTKSPNFQWLMSLADPTTATAFKQGESDLGQKRLGEVGFAKSSPSMSMNDVASARLAQIEQEKQRDKLGMAKTNAPTIAGKSLASKLRGGSIGIGASRRGIGAPSMPSQLPKKK